MWLTIDNKSERPIYLQIVLQIKEQVRKGDLKTGDELPSVRELADSLGINMHTVRFAYLRLRDQGILNLRLGRRATINKIIKPSNKTAVESEIKGRLDEITTDALLMGLTPAELHKLLVQQTSDLEKEKSNIKEPRS
jgi:GntR family transcriptional regulator